MDGGVYLQVHSYRGIAALSGCDLVRRFSVVDGDAKGISLVHATSENNYYWQCRNSQAQTIVSIVFASACRLDV